MCTTAGPDVDSDRDILAGASDAKAHSDRGHRGGVDGARRIPRGQPRETG
jgi:hypothetical protein